MAIIILQDHSTTLYFHGDKKLLTYAAKLYAIAKLSLLLTGEPVDIVVVTPDDLDQNQSSSFEDPQKS